MQDRAARIKKLIEQSGHNFHYEVVRFLRSREWKVSVSPYYSDYATDQSREVDIIAEKSYPVKMHNLHQPVGVINARLFVECKYIDREIAFWFDDRDKQNALRHITSDTPLKENNVYTEKHHYFSDEKVAKLFSKKPGTEHDAIYKALTQTLHALIYYRGHNISFGAPQLYPKVLAYLAYPVIVCHTFGNFYRVHDDGKNFSDISENFQLEVNYAYISRAGSSILNYFLIDVVDFDRMENFLALLEETDIEAIAKTSHPALWV